MISDKRLQTIVELVEEKGIDFVKDAFDLKESTIERYIRKYKTISKPSKDIFIPARVLALDIEMSTVSFKLWRAGKQYVSPYDQSTKKFCICWAGKWLDTGEKIGGMCTPEEAINRDDLRIMGELNLHLQKADVVLGHNIDKYDLPTVYAKFIEHSLSPVSISSTIDTYKVAKKNRFIGNGLDYLLHLFGFSGKIKVDKQLWIDAEAGDEEQIKKMYKYCQRDVDATVELYIKLRPYMKSHPNFSLMNMNDNVCPVCGSKNMTNYKDYFTNVNSYEQFKCDDCGSIFRSGKAIRFREHGSEKYRVSAK